MFEFSKIDKDLTIYRENDVIIFGASSAGIKVKHLLERHGIEIAAFVDNNVNKVGKDIEKIKIISFEECLEYVQHKPTVVQIGSTYEKEIAEQLKNRGIDCYIWYTEFLDRIKALNKWIFAQKEPNRIKVLDEIKWEFNSSARTRNSLTLFINEYQYTKNVRLIVSAPKTGTSTIQNSVKARNENILPTIYWYKRINVFAQNLLKQYPVKLIIGVRDPVKQNISFMYQELTSGEDSSYYNLDAYWRGGGDVSSIFNEYVINVQEMRGSLVQYFFEQQIEPFLGIDIYQYPFDKEKGYSVYHIHDKLDIFIYQIEKLNSLETEIGRFLEIKDFKLVKDNDSADKWYKESYQNVVKNMPISKRYYEECYSSKYINHFYSTEDIDKFKDQWKVEDSK